MEDSGPQELSEAHGWVDGGVRDRGQFRGQSIGYKVEVLCAALRLNSEPHLGQTDQVGSSGLLEPRVGKVLAEGCTAHRTAP